MVQFSRELSQIIINTGVAIIIINTGVAIINTGIAIITINTGVAIIIINTGVAIIIMGSISHVHLLQSLEIFNSSVHQSDNIQIGSVLEKLPSQKTLSSILDDNLFRVLQGSLSIADRARLLSASSPHASSWLTVTPSEGQGLHLDPPVFQTALKWC